MCVFYVYSTEQKSQATPYLFIYYFLRTQTFLHIFTVILSNRLPFLSFTLIFKLNKAVESSHEPVLLDYLQKSPF